MDCHWTDTVIEDQNVFNTVLVLMMNGKLEDLSCQHVTKAEVRLEYRRHRGDGKHTSHIFAFLLISSEAVKRVLKVGVGEASFDLREVVIVAEGQVVDLVGVVHALSFTREELNDVSERVVTDVEIAWHTIHLDEALESAALATLQFLLDALQQLIARSLLLIVVFD